MNQTTYRGNRPVRSPIQVQTHPAELARRKATDTSDFEHPVRREIRKICGTYQFNATFSEDTDTLATLQHIPGVIAVQCLLQKDGKTVGKGHGTAVLTRINRGIERTAFICLNAAFLSAANSACKVLDALRLDDADGRPVSEKPTFTGSYPAGESYGPEPATDKQKSYLLQLASINLGEGDREQFAASIEDMTKEEASRSIAEFAR